MEIHWLDRYRERNTEERELFDSTEEQDRTARTFSPDTYKQAMRKAVGKDEMQAHSKRFNCDARHLVLQPQGLE